jgi:hypothetical protein
VIYRPFVTWWLGLAYGRNRGPEPEDDVCTVSCKYLFQDHGRIDGEEGEGSYLQHASGHRRNEKKGVLAVTEG